MRKSSLFGDADDLFASSGAAPASLKSLRDDTDGLFGDAPKKAPTQTAAATKPAKTAASLFGDEDDDIWN